MLSLSQTRVRGLAHKTQPLGCDSGSRWPQKTLCLWRSARCSGQPRVKLPPRLRGTRNRVLWSQRQRSVLPSCVRNFRKADYSATRLIDDLVTRIRALVTWENSKHPTTLTDASQRGCSRGTRRASSRHTRVRPRHLRPGPNAQLAARRRE